MKIKQKGPILLDKRIQLNNHQTQEFKETMKVIQKNNAQKAKLKEKQSSYKKQIQILQNQLSIYQNRIQLQKQVFQKIVNQYQNGKQIQLKINKQYEILNMNDLKLQVINPQLNNNNNNGNNISGNSYEGIAEQLAKQSKQRRQRIQKQIQQSRNRRDIKLAQNALNYQNLPNNYFSYPYFPYHRDYIPFKNDKINNQIAATQIQKLQQQIQNLKRDHKYQLTDLHNLHLNEKQRLYDQLKVANDKIKQLEQETSSLKKTIQKLNQNNKAENQSPKEGYNNPNAVNEVKMSNKNEEFLILVEEIKFFKGYTEQLKLQIGNLRTDNKEKLQQILKLLQRNQFMQSNPVSAIKSDSNNNKVIQQSYSQKSLSEGHSLYELIQAMNQEQLNIYLQNNNIHSSQVKQKEKQKDKQQIKDNNNQNQKLNDKSLSEGNSLFEMIQKIGEKQLNSFKKEKKEELNYKNKKK